MTCPCGHYDYVDSTVETLADAMACVYDSHHHEHFLCLYLNTDHRKHGNRIIHETLTGSSLFPGITYDPNQRE